MIDWTDPRSYGDPNLWSFDCIGLVRWAWYKATRQDIVSERTTQSTWQNPGYAHTKFTKEQGEAPLLPGDILYFGTGITHVALYLGDGKVVEAPDSGDVVRSRTPGGTDTRGRSGRTPQVCSRSGSTTGSAST
ncbi:NlpC/P60 family protein [Streptomyces sp. NPDC006147]|uniref:C40 family peptidase n=1 Tax=unclassified Streptomyces TaxID=2593676 RepID=UPI0033A984CC